MQHLTVLDSYKEFKYIFYLKNKKLNDYYLTMYNELEKAGHAGLMIFELNGGILLESEDRVIGGSFLNFHRYNHGILILCIFVDPAYRRQGIWKTMHKCIDKIAKNKNKKEIWSAIHVNNLPMLEALKTINYTTEFYTVKRNLQN